MVLMWRELSRRSSAALSAVTISVPVSMLAGTSTPLTASSAACAPIEPIFAGNWATEASWSPATIAATSSGPASNPTSMTLEPAAWAASMAPMMGGPQAP